MARGGLPADENARKIAIATKYAIAHKGILLQREKEHLKILGISIEKYAEILFLAGQMHANNMLAVFCINEVIFYSGIRDHFQFSTRNRVRLQF